MIFAVWKAKISRFPLIPLGQFWVRHCCFCKSACPCPLVTQSLSLGLSQWMLKPLKLNKCLTFIWFDQLSSLNKHSVTSTRKVFSVTDSIASLTHSGAFYKITGNLFDYNSDWFRWFYDIFKLKILLCTIFNELKLRQMTVLDKNHVFFYKKLKKFFKCSVFIVLSDKLFHGWECEF